MAKNQTRSMDSEFHQGSVDETYIQLCPDRGVVENPPLDRLAWPSYTNAEVHIDSPFMEAAIRRAVLPAEYRGPAR